MSQRFLLLFLHAFFFTLLAAVGQSNTVEGIVLEAETGRPIPFAHLSLNEGSQHFLADQAGLFSVESLDSIKQIQVHARHTHESIELSTDSSFAFPLTLELPRIRKFFYSEETTLPAKHLMRWTLEKSRVHHPERLAPYTHETYNKLVLTADSAGVKRMKGLVNRLLSKHTFKKIDNLAGYQHLILSESITEVRYYDELHHDETVTASQFSGIEDPLLLGVNASMQSLSPYESNITLFGDQYISPISRNIIRAYEYVITDSIPLENDTLVMVRFNPSNHARFKSLQGYLFINKNYAVEKAIVQPAIKDISLLMVMENQWVDSLCWFPKATTTYFYKSLTLDKKKTELATIIRTEVIDPKRSPELHPEQFDPVILRWSADSLSQQDSSYWEQQRPTSLSPKDSATYQFYEETGQLKQFEKILNVGELVYFKEIPVGPVSIEADKLVNFNKHEGLRLGIGAHTNDKLIKNVSLGGYLAYGFKDKEGKYGFGGNYTREIPSISKRPVTFSLYHRKDVAESAQEPYALNTFQYPTEWLRHFGVSRMDNIRETTLQMRFQPRTYLQSVVGINISQSAATYPYIFQGESDSLFHYFELQAEARYVFGEKFIEVLEKDFSLGSKHPYLYLRIDQGIKGIAKGEFSYLKLMAKLEHGWKFPRVGHLRFQLSAGNVFGDVPYFKLFTGKGTRGNGGVIHNTFETMGHNEYLSNRFLYLFLSHNFGSFHYTNYKHFNPSIEVAFNTGIGQLTTGSSHQGIAIKTLEKPYFESGFLLNNIIVGKPLGIKTGFGAGAYTRFGPQRLDGGFGKNLFFKFILILKP